MNNYQVDHRRRCKVGQGVNLVSGDRSIDFIVCMVGGTRSARVAEVSVQKISEEYSVKLSARDEPTKIDEEITLRIQGKSSANSVYLVCKAPRKYKATNRDYTGHGAN